MNIQWRGAMRHYLQVVAFCFVIAVLTHMIWPGMTYPQHVGYALCIGTINWLIIEFGRYLIDEKYCHRDDGGGHGWPKGWRGLLLISVGIGGGIGLGEPLGHLWFGQGQRPTSHDNWTSLVVSALAAVVIVYYFHSRGKAAELRAQVNAVQRDASEAKLKLLEAQLEPHMMFNTLANLRVLIATDPPRAQDMLDHLIAYLRATLGGARTALHPLADEFARLSDYLEIMAVRMGPRLVFTLDLPDALRDATVPPLLLQPLVENAIRHGLEPKVSGGDIQVRASTLSGATGDLLLLEVTDSGAGLAASTVHDTGGASSHFGLTQVRERLANLYGELGTLELIAAHAGGTSARVTFPLNFSAA